MIKVFHDFLSFTFRPQAASSERMIQQLQLKHSGVEWREWASANIQRAKWDGVNLKATCQELYSHLDTNERRTMDAEVGNYMIKVLNRLKELIYDFDYISRGFGHFGYLNSYSLVRGGKPCGIAAYGGRNCGAMVQLTGRGCADVDMVHMHDLLSGLPQLKITRVDLAADCKRGEYNYDWCDSQYAAGGFTLCGRTPTFSEIKSGGRLASDGSKLFDGGKTFTVGKRENGKMFRGYEKGRQLLGRGILLEPELKEWFRLEVELHNNSRVLPLDILLNPTEYFAGSYPCLSFISALAKPIKTIQKVAKVEVKKLINHAKTSYGSLVRVLRRIGKTDTEIVDMLISNRDTVPRRLEQCQYFNTA